jgi:type II secretory pathway component PulK
MMTRHARRNGLALVWSLVILFALGVLAGTAAWQIVAARATLDRREHSLQALWLARSGAELASARLLDDPNYTGETIEIIPDSNLTIEVTRVDDQGFRIHCASTYPVSDRTPTTRSFTWNATRSSDSLGLRLDILNGGV